LEVGSWPEGDFKVHAFWGQDPPTDFWLLALFLGWEEP
jgi:hypothetical protein